MSDLLTDEQLTAIREHPEPNIVRVLLAHIDAQVDQITKLRSLVLLARRERDAYKARLDERRKEGDKG